MAGRAPGAYVRSETRSEELPSIVWIVPSPSTFLTTPMCPSQTIRSPGCGVTPPPVFGIALPALLRPRVDVVHAAEALAVVAERHACLAGGPGSEVRAPRADAGAGGRLAVLGDARESLEPGGCSA